jgi:uncharacterized protein (DUF1800 family)
VRATTAAFTAAQGDIPRTLRALFATPEFRAPAAREAKFKRPFHFVISALRATNAETDGAKPLIDYLLRLGHAPFRYTTPDGYPEAATHWKSTLLWRWNFATALTANRIKGTRLALDMLRSRVGGDEALAATLLGRRPTAEESGAFHAADGDLALIVASPAFQRC